MFNKTYIQNANPTPKDTKIQLLALWDSFLAPFMSPIATFPLTCAAWTMDTIPNGGQQQTVARMA